MWRCWLVWGQRWQIVLLPSLCLVAGIGTVSYPIHHSLHLTHETVCKILVTKQQYLDTANGSVLLAVYLALTLATDVIVHLARDLPCFSCRTRDGWRGKRD